MLLLFLVRENCVYTLDDERKFLGLFGNAETNPSEIEIELEDIAKQVQVIKHTTFATLNDSLFVKKSFYVSVLPLVRIL